MKRIEIRMEELQCHYHDCCRIKEALNEEGYDLSLVEAYHLWREYSEKLCAGWIIIFNNSDVYDCVKEFIIN